MPKQEKAKNKKGAVFPPEHQVEYTFQEGLRFVKPYSHSFTTYAKRRWFGHQIGKIYTKEFKAFSAQYYLSAI